MTIKPAYGPGFMKAFVGCFILIFIMWTGTALLQHQRPDYNGIIWVGIYGGGFLSVAILVMFTPREITWDDASITIRALFPGNGSYQWSDLEAYTPFARAFSTFMIKFRGQQAFQIVPVALPKKDWQAFQQFLRENFPERKTLMWLGPMPLRRGGKR